MRATDGVREVADGNIEAGGSILCVRVVYQNGGEIVIKAYESILPLIQVGFLYGLCEEQVRGNRAMLWNGYPV